MIKTVLFDLGNVILPFDLTRVAKKLTAFSPLSAPEILEKMGADNILNAFESGQLAPLDYFDYVIKSCQLRPLSYEQFVEVFNDIFEEDDRVAKLIETLKKNYKLGLISNTNPIHVSYIKTTYATLSHFDRQWFSNEAGIRKPDPSIYKMALDHFDSKPEEAIFIDDVEPNIRGAKALGINAILYTNYEKLEQDLISLGVLK